MMISFCIRKESIFSSEICLLVPRNEITLILIQIMIRVGHGLQMQYRQGTITEAVSMLFILRQGDSLLHHPERIGEFQRNHLGN